MKTNTKLHQLTFLFLAMLFLIVSSCTKEEDPVLNKTAPDLPPENSFAINFNDFSDIDTTAFKSSLTYQNWGWTATNVAVWNTVLTITLVVPVAAFYESFNHQGIYDPDTDSWVWSYNFFAGGVAHLASLHASLVSEGVKWEMYISKNNQYSDFLWYSGVSALDNTHGYWELNQNPQEPNEFIYIEWNRNLSDGTAEIKYTNVIPGNASNGSYIYYGIDESQNFDAFYNIFAIAEDNMVNIEWSRADKDGRVRDAFHFGDFDWRCWDMNLMDITCE
ncbi:MAG: hypothetical protein K9G76_02750 [Bacteroidales bacterium]|nr:hypothetical protein [Bacteroidales bacterium]MCF8405922.1 hypothetical protein [Bacteroidales bacterium]